MTAGVKERVVAAVRSAASTITGVSQEIHAHPELGYEERFASNTLADVLAAGGFEVERGAYGVETSFAARLGDGPGPHVVLCCEYDALPGIGHGCGHNIIAAAGMGAGLALAGVVSELGGRLTVLGTPAEELGGGGKIRLAEAGAFSEADVAMMVHPSVADVGWAPHIATTRLHVTMRGKPSHAAAAPWNGVNALDAIVLAYMAVSALRQQMRPSEKVHGIITHGGDAENIIPERAAATFQVRAPNERRLDPILAKVRACFEGAAVQTGCRAEIDATAGYAELLWNGTLCEAYQANGPAVGRTFSVDPRSIPVAVAGSTDMGNVSKIVPSLHAMIGIAPLPTPGHSHEFAEYARSESGDRGAVDGAALLALTTADLWSDGALLAAARDEFERERARHSSAA